MRKLKNDELGRLRPEELEKGEKLNARVILDNIRSMNNVGSAFRTSDAFRIEKIHLCGITATPPHRDINKTALGATETVAWEHSEDLNGLVAGLRTEGYHIVAVEQADKSTSLLDFEPRPDKQYAFIFGNEVFGVNEEAVKNADTVLEIPQYGVKHSLNISVSLGIVIWDFVAKLK